MYRSPESVNVLIFQSEGKQVGEVIAPNTAWLPIPEPLSAVQLAEPKETPTTWQVGTAKPHYAFIGGNIVVTVPVIPAPHLT